MEQQVELTRESAALAWGTPQVVAYRVARMALVDPVPSGRDQREFMRMGSEKLEAFQAAWITAFSRGMAWQQVVAMDWANLGWQLGCGAGWLSPRAMQEMALDNVMTAFTSTLDVAASSVRPVSERVEKNARRLARTPLRRAQRKNAAPAAAPGA